MFFRVVGVRKPSSRFDHDLHTHTLPLQCRRIFSLKTRIVLPSTCMLSAPAETLFGRFPSTESYFNKWASVLGSVRSLTATNSKFGSRNDARRTFLPILPKPLMPTFIAMYPPI